MFVSLPEAEYSYTSLALSRTSNPAIRYPAPVLMLRLYSIAGLPVFGPPIIPPFPFLAGARISAFV